MANYFIYLKSSFLLKTPKNHLPYTNLIATLYEPYRKTAKISLLNS